MKFVSSKVFNPSGEYTPIIRRWRGNTCYPACLVTPSSIFQDSDGVLDFLPGERLKFISVTIVDNPVPELDKIFRVELYNADGGGERELFSLVSVTF